MTIDYHTCCEEKFIVCFEPDVFYTCAYTTNGQITTTGQPNMQAFDTFEDAYEVFSDKITDPTILVE